MGLLNNEQRVVACNVVCGTTLIHRSEKGKNMTAMTRLLCTSVILFLATGTVARATNYNEGINGDLSGNRLIPTDLVLTPGTNSVIATSVRNDREYLHITVPGGFVLSALINASYTGNDGTAFVGVQAGSTFTEDPATVNVANLLGWSHFGTNLATVGEDILDDIGLGDDAIGFTPPLPAGDYTFWIQQTGTNACTYQFDFMVTPEPASLGLLLIGLSALRRRK